MEKQALLNTYINNVTMPETIAAIEKMIADNKKSYVVAINVDVVMKIENDPYCVLNFAVVVTGSYLMAFVMNKILPQKMASSLGMS